MLEYDSPLTTDRVADRVFGQPNFTTQTGQPLSANSLNAPFGVAVDAAGNLWVADGLNSRVLEYDAPLTSDATADRVFGQPNFTSQACAGGVDRSASTLCLPQTLKFDSAGNLWVADSSNHRVLEYDSPLTTDTVADRVFGQPNFNQTGCALTASGICNPRGIAFDAAGSVYVTADQARILRYDSPLTTDAIADGVIGQPNFTTSTCANSATQICSPFGLAIIGADLYVSDASNNRILRGTTTTLGSQVFGQLGSFTSGFANNGGESARSLSSPRGIATDAAGRLYVAEYDNSRVLVFNTGPDPDLDFIAFAIDNCGAVYNPSQANHDANFIDNSPPYVPAVDDKTLAVSDGAGDACDLDADNDGMLDATESTGPPCDSATAATDPMKLDSDGDRVTDGAECALGSDPANAASKPAAPAPGRMRMAMGCRMRSRR